MSLTGTISVTRELEFAYAHYLPGYRGKCAQLHGHNAKVAITLSRTVENFLELQEAAIVEGGYINGAYGGMVADFGDIKHIANDLIAQLDHTYLNDNDVIPADEVPTAENMAIRFAERLQQEIDLDPMRFPAGVRVTKVRVYETPNNYAEWSDE